jgi:hypothetical protein
MTNEPSDESKIENELPIENKENEADFDEYSLGLNLMQHIEGQLERADNKAQFTLTIEALLLASSTIWGSTVTQSPTISSMAFLDIFILILSVLVLIILVASTIVAMLAVMPKLASPNEVNNIFYFGSITDTEEATFTHLIKSYTDEEIITMLFSEIYALSEIAKRKYELIQRSYYLLFLAIGLWTLTQTLIIVVG